MGEFEQLAAEAGDGGAGSDRHGCSIGANSVAMSEKGCEEKNAACVQLKVVDDRVLI